MKFLKRVLILLLTVGIIWGIREVGPHFAPLWRGFEGAGEVEKKNYKGEKPSRFAVMSDVHSDWENFQKALEKAKTDMEIGPSFVPPVGGTTAGKGFVIITGDLTTIGTKNELLEAKKILEESGLRYYVIPGNHDVWWGRKYKRDVWEEVFGESFESFREDGAKFILINNGDAVGGINQFKVQSSKFKVDEEETQMDWLKKETEECLKVYCLVFMHIPLNHPNSLHVMGEESPLVASEAAELINLLVKNQVKEVFAGHLHFSSSYELGGLKTTIVGAIASERNLQSPKFLEAWNEGGNLRKESIFLSD